MVVGEEFVELARLGGYRELLPPADLWRIVETVWLYARPRPEGAAIPGRGHRVLPDTGVSLCFRCHRCANGSVADGELILMGPIGSIRFFAPGPGLHLEAVKLKPEWCRDLLAAHPAEHVDGLDTLSVTDPLCSARCLDRLMRSGSSHEAVRILLDSIRERLSECRFPRDARLAHLGLERVRVRDAWLEGCAEVAAELGISPRHLRRVTKATTGFAPKHHHRILRLNRTVAAADRLDRPDWSRLAVEAGYYDQSHLIQECAALAGETPTALHGERMVQRPPAPERSRSASSRGSG